MGRQDWVKSIIRLSIALIFTIGLNTIDVSGATANEQLDYTPKIDSFRKIGEQIDITALYNQEPEISPSIDSLIAVSRSEERRVGKEC